MHGPIRLNKKKIVFVYTKLAFVGVMNEQINSFKTHGICNVKMAGDV